MIRTSVALLTLLVIGVAAAADDGIDGVPFAFGASVPEVQQALDIRSPPQVLPRPSTALPEGDAALRSPIHGISAFFRKSGHMYLLRLDPPFEGSVAGVKFGDPRAVVVQKLGNPQRKVRGPLDSSDAYLYPVAGNLTVRFDFDGSDNVEKMMVFPTAGLNSVK